MATTTNTCGDGCGWIAGIIAAVAYGSFGVPVRQTKHIDVHPLVLQTFKTVTMFVLSWSVTLADVTPSWTWWGLVSGTLWVLGGTGGIYAIRMAGLAIAVGVWASVMIGVNFVWGILVFREPIHDVLGTLAAFVLLTAGLVGMSTYAAPPPNNNQPESTAETSSSSVEMERKNLNVWDKQNHVPTEFSRYDRMENEEISSADALAGGGNVVPSESADDDKDNKIVFDWQGILQLTQRQAGIAGAVFNGLMTGSSLIPLHYAKAQGYGGANYMISMASGALMSNILLWMLMYVYMCRQVALQKNDMTSSSSSGAISTNTTTDENNNASSVSTLTASDQELPGIMAANLLEQGAYQRMSAWHFNELAIPGVMAGILLTIAMFGSIMSVTYLGQGIGNSIVQTKILVSGKLNHLHKSPL